MRRIIVIVCGCCIVGLTATAAHSQQSGQRKPGFLGRILGLKTVPDARQVMDGNQQVQRHEQQQRAKAKQLQVGPRAPFAQRRRRSQQRLEQLTSSTQLMQIRPGKADSAATAEPAVSGGEAPGKIRRVTSNSGRTVSSYTVPAGGLPTEATEVRRPQSLSLAKVLRNRQSQPLNEVTRTARKVKNPFAPDADDVYQPIASGPVPVPDTFVVQETPEETSPAPQPLALPPMMPRSPMTEDPALLQQGDAKPEAVVANPSRELPESRTLVEPELPPVVQPDAPSEPIVATIPEMPREDVVQEQVTTTARDEDFVLPVEVPGDPSLWRTGTSSSVRRQAAVSNMHPVRRIAEPQTEAVATVPTVPERPRTEVRVSQSARTSVPVATPKTVSRPAVVRTSPPVAAVEQMKIPVQRAAQRTVRPERREIPLQQRLPQITGRANTGGLPVIRPRGHSTMPTVTPSATAQYETVTRAVQRMQRPVRTPVAMPRREPNTGDDRPGRVTLFPQGAPKPEPVLTEPTAMRPRPQPVATPKPTIAKRPIEVAQPKEQVIQPASRRVEASSVDAVRPAVRTRSASVTGPRRKVRYVDPKVKRQQAISDRPHLLGFKGFCPVELRDHRRLVDSGLDFYASVGDRTFYFSSAEARSQFVANPKRYMPAAGGRDVVLLTHTGTQLEGKLDFAAWYQGRLFLFTSQQALDAFQTRPNMYADRF